MVKNGFRRFHTFLSLKILSAAHDMLRDISSGLGDPYVAVSNALALIDSTIPVPLKRLQVKLLQALLTSKISASQSAKAVETTVESTVGDVLFNVSI